MTTARKPSRSPTRHAVAKDAATYEYAPRQAQIHVLLGIAELRQGANSAARQSFTTAVEHADAQLQRTPQNYAALERKALARCGLALTADPDHLPDALAATDGGDLLAPARCAARGRE